MKPAGAALLLALSLAATAAGAQEPAPSDTGGDPIADLIGALPPDQSTDEAEPEATPTAPSTAIQSAPFTPGAQPAVPILTAPAAPPPAATPPGYVRAAPYDPTDGGSIRPAAPARPRLDRPVMIDEAGVSPDGPPTALDLGYEARIRGSAASAQGLQGPLDGGWTVRGPDGAAIYGFQLVDRGGYGPLEGAWRAMGGSGRVGLIDSLDRQGSILIIRVTRVYGKTAVLTLTATSDGSWVGDMVDEGGTRAVTMRRN